MDNLFIANFAGDFNCVLSISESTSVEEVKNAICLLFQKHYKKDVDSITRKLTTYYITSGDDVYSISIVKAKDFLSF